MKCLFVCFRWFVFQGGQDVKKKVHLSEKIHPFVRSVEEDSMKFKLCLIYLHVLLELLYQFSAPG